MDVNADADVNDREIEDRERHEAQSLTSEFGESCGVAGCSVCDPDDAAGDD